MNNYFFSGRHAFVSLLIVCCLLMGGQKAFSQSLLVVGNSLTQHGPAPDIGWTGNWGMAASSEDKDFVHLLVKKLETHTKNTIALSIVPGYPVEKNFFNETENKLPDVVGGSYDYIVLEIGDNIDFANPLKATFQDRYRGLVDKLKTKLGKNGVLVCLGKWWSNEVVDAQIRSSCEAGMGKFVLLKPISSQIESKASYERQFANAGVGSHPGDWAMQKISEAIFCMLTDCTAVKIQKGKQADIGVFYFPGWQSQSRNWKDIKGLPDSRSPNLPWPDREPLLGYYAEEDIKVAEQHIEWASQYGVSFFAYDWYWDGKSTGLSHAIDNYLKASNNSKLKFSMLWANHSDVPRSLKEFEDMVSFWLQHYLAHPQYYRINEKPAVFVFSNGQLETNAKKFGWSAKLLLEHADEMARNSGLSGIFFIATTNAKPSDELENQLAGQGFSAYSGWNYVVSKDKSPVADYQSMADTYLDFYAAASNTKGALPYIAPASPGWDDRPWHGTTVRSDSTPAKFKQMLVGAKQLIDSGKPGIPRIVMIEAWNEFGEGAYIEPTKKWGFEYLKTISDVFGKSAPPASQPK